MDTSASHYDPKTRSDIGGVPVGGPLRLAIGAVVAAGCFWLIATTTLPYALATQYPELALRLNANQPIALMVLAERRRDLVAALDQENATVPTTTPARFANRALLTSDPALADRKSVV